MIRYLVAQTSLVRHRVGKSRTPRQPASAPGTEVLCGWKIQDAPVTAWTHQNQNLVERACVTCEREARRIAEHES